MSGPSDLQDTVTTERAPALLSFGMPAPDLTLPDETGTPRRLSEFWTAAPALVMFWRHFGCSCGVARAERLIAEIDAYREVNLTPSSSRRDNRIGPRAIGLLTQYRVRS
jgi:hypothetical protein